MAQSDLQTVASILGLEVPFSEGSSENGILYLERREIGMFDAECGFMLDGERIPVIMFFRDGVAHYVSNHSSLTPVEVAQKLFELKDGFGDLFSSGSINRKHVESILARDIFQGVEIADDLVSFGINCGVVYLTQKFAYMSILGYSFLSFEGEMVNFDGVKFPYSFQRTMEHLQTLTLPL